MASGGEQKLPEQASTGRFIVGVDEAGRGPVLGPLVYAAVGVHSDDAGSLEGSELADSKQLGVAKREELAEKLEGDERFFTATVVLTPACISAGMLGRRRRSLNDMSFEATERALAKLQNKSVGLDELYVDTLGDPAHHADRLKRSFPASHCVAESKASLLLLLSSSTFPLAPFLLPPFMPIGPMQADSKYAIVAAASIVAKTSRDSLLGSWRFVEPVDPSTPSLGSGYPGGNWTILPSSLPSLTD